jgi:predicted DsbA family dithiol-disulfide isomerase
VLAAMVVLVAAEVSAHGQTDNKVIAIVDGRNITQDEVDRTIWTQIVPLEKKLYAIRKAALENLISRSLLEHEAARRKVSVAELRTQLAAGEVRVAENQVEEAYAANAPFFGAMSPDEARERLRLDLENQQRMHNYRNGVAKLKERASIRLNFPESRSPGLIDEAEGQTIGPKDAPVTIVLYSDFECQFCRTAQSTIKQLLQVHEKNVRLVFKHLPLEIHQYAFPAAQAAFCAGEQGQFWAYHDALFKTERLTSQLFKQIAIELGLDTKLFAACVLSEKSRLAVAKSTSEASQLGINSTPTFVINGKLISGAITLEEFKSIIEQELRSTTSSASNQ